MALFTRSGERSNPLSQDQIQTFLKDGVLVVEDILSHNELEAARQGLVETLARNGVDEDNLNNPTTARNLQSLSSTNGSGGVLDLFYDQWKLEVAMNQRLFDATTQLWQAAYCHEGEQKSDLDESERFKWYPFGPFDTRIGYAYLDRIGFRLPTAWAEQLGHQLAAAAKQGEASKTSNRKKKRPLQRSLTPHLDCCPDNLYEEQSKWRPIQCFVSLTDNLEPNTGGFEAARGFHRSFAEWAKTRPPTVITRQTEAATTESTAFPAPCIGAYTHIRPKEDADVIAQIQHIPVPAGAAVFWDNRVPHANSYTHVGETPRSVVYCSFLPDVPINRTYVDQQLQNMRAGRQPTDQWITPPHEDCSSEAQYNGVATVEHRLGTLTEFQKRLLGVIPWAI